MILVKTTFMILQSAPQKYIYYFEQIERQNCLDVKCEQ